MTRKINYSELAKIEFTEDDITAVIMAAEASGFRDGGKELAVLNLSNFNFETSTPQVLTAFAALATVIGRPVSKVYAGLAVKRELTDDEKRDIALDALRYAYGDTARRIREERAGEQGIDIWQEEEPKG